MARKPPVKKKAKATARRKSKPESAGLPRAVREQIKQWKEISLARGRLAQEAFDHQDAETQAVLSRVRDRLLLGANGIVRFTDEKGRTFHHKVEMEYLGHNAMFIATEILKDLALMDVRVAHYEFPLTLCAECNERIAKVPVPRRKGGRIK